MLNSVLPADIPVQAADIPCDNAWPVISTHTNWPPLAVCWNDQINANNRDLQILRRNNYEYEIFLIESIQGRI